MSYRNTIINIDNTRFNFTNFSGDPNRDLYHSDKRAFGIKIPDAELAQRLQDMGVNVKWTRPQEGRVYENGFTPTAYVRVNVGIEAKWPPKIVWITPNGRKKEVTDPETLSQLDYIRVKNVNCQVKMKERKMNPGHYTLYADVVYIEQDVDYDPYAAQYASYPEATAASTQEEAPF